MPTEKPEGKGVEEGKSGGDGAGGGKTVPAADHPAARATTAGDGAAAIQVGAFDDSGGKEVAYDPISKTFFGGEGSGGKGGWEKTADGSIAACDPHAMLNALMSEALVAEDVDELNKLLDFGAKIDYRDTIHGSGTTPLMLAITKGMLDIARLLLNRGADSNIRDENGRSPLHAACRKHDRRFIELLLSFKSTDVNALMKNTLVTPLHILARDGDVELCDLLIRHGATVDCKTSHGETPLHFACRDAHVGVVKLLIRQGADFMAQVNVLQRVPMHFVCQNGCSELALMFFRMGCSPYVKEFNGRTALDLARTYNHMELATTLVHAERDRREKKESDRIAAVKAAILAEQEAKARAEEERLAREAEARRVAAEKRAREKAIREAQRIKEEQEKVARARKEAKDRIMKIAKDAARRRKKKEAAAKKAKDAADRAEMERQLEIQRKREEARSKGVS